MQVEESMHCRPMTCAAASDGTARMAASRGKGTAQLAAAQTGWAFLPQMPTKFAAVAELRDGESLLC